MTPTSTPRVAIDLGSSVITTVVGERREQGQLHILGVGQSPSSGIEAGQVNHVARAATAIRQSLDQAEASSGREILSVGLAVTGAHLQSVLNRGAVALPSFGEPIRDADLARAIDSGRAVTLDGAHTLLHAIPRFYIVDSERRSFDPRGQHGQRLDVSMHLVSASQSAIRNATECVESAGVDIELIAAKPVVAAERAVGADEKEFGALVIGLDAGTTTLTAFEDGAISHTSALPIGAGHIARDLSMGLGCSFEEARRVMDAHGLAIPQLAPPDAPPIELQRLNSAVGEPPSAPVSLVAEIIHARVCEIITMVCDRVVEQQLRQPVAGGVILTGGGARLGGIDLLVSKALDTRARVAATGQLYGLTDRVDAPDACGALGMLEWMLDSGDSVRGAPARLWRSGASDGSMLSSLASAMSTVARAFSPNS